MKWRKSILQVGKIAGWQTALLVGCKTFKKAEINAEDIIEANYEILLKNSEIWVSSCHNFIYLISYLIISIKNSIISIIINQILNMKSKQSLL